MSKQSISFIVTNSGTITAVIGAKNYSVPKDHRHYEEIKKAMVDGDSVTFEKLANASEGIRKFAKGKVAVSDGVVYYNGEAVNNVLTERIIKFMAEGFPFKPMLNFLENLMMNPSKRSVDQLYSFMEHQGIPITEDGCLLAYKRVDDNWMDFHTRTILNKIGTVVKMDRNKVDDDPNAACKQGLHAGAMGYVAGFNSGGHVIVVKINPKNVVSIPYDSSCQKLRCCEYEVLSEYVGELTAPVYDKAGGDFEDWNNEDSDEDDDDYDYDSELEDDEEEDNYILDRFDRDQ